MNTDKATDLALRTVMLPAILNARVLFIAAGVPMWAVGLVRGALNR